MLFVTRVLLLLALATLLAPSKANVGKMVCFYDAASHIREGPAQMSLSELEPALQFCNYLVYGYASIDKSNFKLEPLLPNLDIGQNHYRKISELKQRHRNLNILLSVGGDKDLDDFEGGTPFSKYLILLENAEKRQVFVNSVVERVKNYGFDGIDLAWQFPKNHPKQVKNALKKAWSSFKGWFTGPKIVDEKAEEHKQQFAALISELKNALRTTASLLTLTILPNVNADLFIDIPKVMPHLDFVNLATFDYQTPQRDPKIADYSAPLYELFERDPENNANYQVNFWLNNSAPAQKLNLGITTYGRAWIMSKDSGITGHPTITKTLGEAPAGKYTVTPGLLSWPEICEKLSAGKEMTGEMAALRKVSDPTRRFGTYAYRAADDNGEHGLWVSYEDPSSAADKAGYVNAKSLGGVALFDLSMDDFKGQCAGEKFPILRGIKYKL